MIYLNYQLSTIFCMLLEVQSHAESVTKIDTPLYAMANISKYMTEIYQTLNLRIYKLE